MKYTAHTQIRTTPEQKQAFKQACKKKGTTPSKFLREAMNYLTKHVRGYYED